MGEMNPPTDTLTPELAAVLRAVSRMDLTTALAVGKVLGRSPTEDLDALRELRFVRVVVSTRHDGTPNRFFTPTAQGTDALISFDREGDYVPVPTIGPRPSLTRETYMGGELQPFAERAGSMDALKYPSRVGDQRRYPEGASKTTDQNAEPIPVKASKRR